MRYLIFVICLAVLFNGCQKYNIKKPDFEVSADGYTFKVGDTVKFDFHGKADFLTFYSGEFGHNYDYRFRTVAEDNILQVDFKTWITTAYFQNLRFLISTDLNGYAPDDVRNATWTDLTDKFAWSPSSSPNDDQYPSGALNLLPYSDGGKPVFIAFHYTENPTEFATRWVVRAINVNSVTPIGETTALGTMATMEWKTVNLLDETTKWAVSSAQLLINAEGKNDDWVISKSFDGASTQPDRGIAIRDISLPMLRSYEKVYSKPGEYKATFVGRNVTVENSFEVVHQINITVEP